MTVTINNRMTIENFFIFHEVVKTIWPFNTFILVVEYRNKHHRGQFFVAFWVLSIPRNLFCCCLTTSFKHFCQRFSKNTSFEICLKIGTISTPSRRPEKKIPSWNFLLIVYGNRNNILNLIKLENKTFLNVIFLLSKQSYFDFLFGQSKTSNFCFVPQKNYSEPVLNLSSVQNWCTQENKLFWFLNIFWGRDLNAKVIKAERKMEEQQKWGRGPAG